MGSPASLRAMIGLCAVLVVLLTAGVLFLGLGGGTSAAAAADGCTQRPFAYSAAEHDRQQRFESSLADGAAALPQVGFHAEALDPVASLHAASHGHVVVYFRPGTPTAALKAFADAALARKVPVLVSPRAQRAAIVAVIDDREATCADAGGVRAFAAGFYPSLDS